MLNIIAPLRGSHGLSARRARRTKSSRPEGPKAGPKGRNLEVGAQRAPRLLFKDNSRPLLKVADLRFSTCSVVKLCRISLADAMNEEQKISLCKNLDAIQALCGRLQVHEVNIFCENIINK